MKQMTAMSQRQSEDAAKILAYQEELKNTLTYICSSHHYYQACVNCFFARHEWPQPMPSSYTRPLPVEGPPFEPCVVPSEPIGVYHPIIDGPDDSLYADKDFLPDVPDE